MANSRGRRKLRKQLQEAGLGSLLVLPSPIPAPKTPPFWKRVLAVGSAFLGVAGALITIAGSYPWLSVDRGDLIDPTNPFSELFEVRNDGYIPVTHLDALCVANFSSSGNTHITLKN